MVNIRQGSWWSSHRGAAFLAKSFDHDSLLAIGSTIGLDWDGNGDSVSVVAVSDTASVLDAVSVERSSETLESVSSVELVCTVSEVALCALPPVSLVPFGLKNPIRLCCPFLGEPPRLVIDFDRFGGGGMLRSPFEGRFAGLGASLSDF